MRHYVVAMDALKAGKHVFCEKPITVNYKLSVEMAEEAKRRGKLLNIGVCNRYNKSVELLEEMNRKGKFGKIYHVCCSFRNYRCIPGLGGDFTTKAQSGGGVLIDWGVHFLDLILYILGGAKLKTVTCDTYGEMAKDMSEYRYLGMWAEDTKDLNLEQTMWKISFRDISVRIKRRFPSTELGHKISWGRRNVYRFSRR